MIHESQVLSRPQVTAPAIPAPSLAPNEIVPMLIGATVGEIERELVLQTLARCDGNRTRAARVLGRIGAHAAQQDPAILRRRHRRPHASRLARATIAI